MDIIMYTYNFNITAYIRSNQMRLNKFELGLILIMICAILFSLVMLSLTLEVFWGIALIFGMQSLTMIYIMNLYRVTEQPLILPPIQQINEHIDKVEKVLENHKIKREKIFVKVKDKEQNVRKIY